MKIAPDAFRYNSRAPERGKKGPFLPLTMMCGSVPPQYVVNHNRRKRGVVEGGVKEKWRLPSQTTTKILSQREKEKFDKDRRSKRPCGKIGRPRKTEGERSAIRRPGRRGKGRGRKKKGKDWERLLRTRDSLSGASSSRLKKRKKGERNERRVHDKSFPGGGSSTIRPGGLAQSKSSEGKSITRLIDYPGRGVKIPEEQFRKNQSSLKRRV